MSVADRLERLAAEHARQIDTLAEQAIASVRAVYADAAKGDSYDRLRTGLTQAVDGVRKAAHAIATTHALEELRIIAGDGVGQLSLSMGPTPTRTDVAQYIDNAVQAARDASITDTVYRGETIIESEALGTYTEGRTAAERSLWQTPRDITDRIGFRVAKVANELRAAPDVQTRENDEGMIPLIAKRWSSLNDRRTCERCRGLDGNLALLTSEFDGVNTPAHARCRCITHLTAVGYVKRERAAMQIQERIMHFDVEVRATEMGEGRVIRNVVASDETLDGHGSIIRAAGWDLERYRKNPVVLWAHKGGSTGHSMPSDVLARAEARVEGLRLLADIHFPKEGMNTNADMVFRMMSAKPPMLRGLSVGFRPLEYHFENEGGENEIVIIDRAELVEISVVPVPSNPNALARALSESHNAAACKCSRRDNMTVEATRNVLPPEIAALLNVDSVEAARGAIASLQLRADELNKRADAEKARADTAEAKLAERIDTETRAVVEGLVKAGRISETLRDSALTLARADIAAFRAMYPEQSQDAPRRAKLEERITPQEPKVTKPTASFDSVAERVNELVQKHLRTGATYYQAHELALAELAKAN